MGTNDQIMQRGNSFTKAFSSNLTTANLKFFPAMVGDPLENKSLPVYRSMKGFILEVICYGFKGWFKFRFPLVDPNLSY